ncbi:unnamed protein product [Zymoseptoria tritici ST99CH_3D1]|nr:unnamed protein product [Zymoseptoria tritici ST99CH_3D1]
MGAETFSPAYPEGSNPFHEPIEISSDDSLNDSSKDDFKSTVDRIDARTVPHLGPEPAAEQSAYIDALPRSRKRTLSTSHADGDNPTAATPSSSARSAHRPNVGAKLKPLARAKSASTSAKSPPPTTRVDTTAFATPPEIGLGTAVPTPLAKRRRTHRRRSSSPQRVAVPQSIPTASRMPGTWPSSPSSSESSADQHGSEGIADVEGLRAVLYDAAGEVWAGSGGDGRVGGMDKGGDVDNKAGHRMHDNTADINFSKMEGEEEGAYDGDVEDGSDR